MIDNSRLNPLTDNNDVINTFVDQALSNPVYNVDSSEGIKFKVYDFKENYFGLRLITNQKDDLLSFYPIYDSGISNKGVIKGISELETEIDAIRSISIATAYLNTLAIDHVFHRDLLPQILNNPISIGFSGFVYSLERQLDPPTIEQADGKLVTTKGSSIFYNAKGRPNYDYIYQFYVEEVNSIFWNDYIEILQIKSSLFRHNNLKVDFNLYATERVLQNNYYPKKGNDIMGIMLLSSELF